MEKKFLPDSKVAVVLTGPETVFFEVSGNRAYSIRIFVLKTFNQEGFFLF